jgi:primosomal protein N' (replication factor Y)
LGHSCECGSSDFNRGRPGSARTASEFGRSFAGAKVVEATGEKLVRKVSGKNTLVIATPGAEPIARDGFAAVVILDASASLAKQNLRATETSVRQWSNAISLLAEDGRAVVAGLRGSLAKNFSLWSQVLIAQEELSNRKELSFPPVVRLGSVTSEQDLISQVASLLQGINGVTVIGPAPIHGTGNNDQWRLIFKYPYALGLDLAKELRAFSLKIGSGKSVSSKSGRNTRPIRIKMYDTEVI